MLTEAEIQAIKLATSMYIYRAKTRWDLEVSGEVFVFDVRLWHVSGTMLIRIASLCKYLENTESLIAPNLHLYVL